eukprot:TRINITY_DN1418_c0_g3_i1.p1 TRINITY_DN1418_c0_g3~~TRINITY_DN1418_c0_g3_i1.p1  ORF type:complete len:1229 (+),score=508.11 TRINITY_DN1418_c0_g3_i1:96-3782(+)
MAPAGLPSVASAASFTSLRQAHGHSRAPPAGATSSTPVTPRRHGPRHQDKPRTPTTRRGVSQTPQPPRRGMHSGDLSVLSTRSASAADDSRPGTPPAPGSRRREGSCGESVVVAVRVRGFLPRELERRDDLCIRMRDRTTEISLPGGGRGKMRFSFDHCFWSVQGVEVGDAPFASQEDVYRTLGVPVVDNAMRGFNAAIIAYGQTGSGKSYSIFGPPESLDPSQGSSELEGLIPRVCKELFRRIRSPPKGTTYKVTASMIEIYMEKVYDLLNSRNQLTIRGDLHGGFTVPGRSRREVRGYSAVEALLQRGEDQKTTAATALNERSSRAHTLFELEVLAVSDARTTMSKLTLCDLAGSERCKDARTVAGGKEFNQACKINMSLLCLGKCVEAVAQRGARPDQLVTEFRNSALTKLLRDSLGGNSKTVILTTLSPSDRDAHTTTQALRFADRAKQIQNHAVINEDVLWEAQVKARLMQQIYQQRLDHLNREFELSKQQAELEERRLVVESKQARLEAERDDLDSQRRELLRGKEHTAAERRRLDELERDLKRRMDTAQQEHDELRQRAAELEQSNARHCADTQEAKREKEELEEEVCFLQTKIDLLKKQFEDQIAAMEAERSEAARKHSEEAERQLCAHRQALERKEERFAEERRRYVEQMMQSVAKLQRDCEIKQERHEAVRRARDEEQGRADRAEREQAAAAARAKEAAQRCGELERALKAAEAHASAVTADLNAKVKEADRLRADLAEAQCAQKAAEDEALERVAAAQKENLRRAAHDRKCLQEAEAALHAAEGREQEVEAQLTAAEEESARAGDELRAAQQRMRTLQQHVGGLTEKLRAAESARQQAEDLGREAAEAAGRREAELHQQLATQRRENERAAEAAAADLRAERERRAAELQKERARHAQELQCERERGVTELGLLRGEAEDRIQAASEDAALRLREARVCAAEAEAELGRAREAHEEELRWERERHEDELQRVGAAHAARLEEERERHREELVSCAREHEAELKGLAEDQGDELRRQRAAHGAERDQLAAQHAAALAGRDEELRRAKEAHAAELRRTRHRLEEAAVRAAEQHSEQLAAAAAEAAEDDAGGDFPRGQSAPLPRAVTSLGSLPTSPYSGLAGTGHDVDFPRAHSAGAASLLGPPGRAGRRRGRAQADRAMRVRFGALAQENAQLRSEAAQLEEKAKRQDRVTQQQLAEMEARLKAAEAALRSRAAAAKDN